MPTLQVNLPFYNQCDFVKLRFLQRQAVYENLVNYYIILNKMIDAFVFYVTEIMLLALCSL